MKPFVFPAIAAVLLALAPALAEAADARQPVPLFPEDGKPKEWVVTAWADLKNPPPDGAAWLVKDGVLHGSDPRGTWLVSRKQYGDFILEFEWKLGERGNSGVALRSPMAGDPAFDGLELQMVDPRYFPADQPPKPSELSGSLYRAAAPKEQVFKPGEWNKYVITCKGSRVTVVLNGITIQDIDLDAQTVRPKRHDDTEATPLKARPRRGHIGFQELSRGGGHVEIRNARILELE